MRSVLKGSSVLCGIDCKSERRLSCTNIYQLILLNRRNDHASSKQEKTRNVYFNPFVFLSTPRIIYLAKQYKRRTRTTMQKNAHFGWCLQVLVVATVGVEGIIVIS
jgi:hypothetical protein